MIVVMDIITQGLLGSALAQAGAKKDEQKAAAMIGFGAGLLADADVLIRSSSDSLLALEFHRHFTHSLIFIPFGAAIAAGVMWPLAKKHLEFRRVYVFCLLGYCLSGLLDACTSYGTHLLWPFADVRTAWSIIAIVDPIFSIALLVGIIIALKRDHVLPARLALAFCFVYMLVGIGSRNAARQTMQRLAETRSQPHERLVVKPTIGNRKLWRSVYLHDGVLYVDAVRLGLGDAKVYPGTAIPFVSVEDFADIPADSVLRHDIERFAAFSDGWIAMQGDNLIIDVRYSLVPTSLDPLWGIEFDRSKPDQHAQYKSFRNMTPERRAQFMNMLRGN
jgi:inner membrane protein